MFRNSPQENEYYINFTLSQNKIYTLYMTHCFFSDIMVFFINKIWFIHKFAS